MAAVVKVVPVAVVAAVAVIAHLAVVQHRAVLRIAIVIMKIITNQLLPKVAGIHSTLNGK